MFGSSAPKLKDDMPHLGAIIRLPTKRSNDWRKSGVVSKVKNQGKTCNSCYAFVAVADIETSLLLSGKNASLS